MRSLNRRRGRREYLTAQLRSSTVGQLRDQQAEGVFVRTIQSLLQIPANMTPPLRPLQRSLTCLTLTYFDCHAIDRESCCKLTVGMHLRATAVDSLRPL